MLDRSAHRPGDLVKQVGDGPVPHLIVRKLNGGKGRVSQQSYQFLVVISHKREIAGYGESHAMGGPDGTRRQPVVEAADGGRRVSPTQQNGGGFHAIGELVQRTNHKVQIELNATRLQSELVSAKPFAGGWTVRGDLEIPDPAMSCIQEVYHSGTGSLLLIRHNGRESIVAAAAVE
jgi:hypothetical protein